MDGGSDQMLFQSKNRKKHVFNALDFSDVPNLQVKAYFIILEEFSLKFLHIFTLWVVQNTLQWRRAQLQYLFGWKQFSLPGP